MKICTGCRRELQDSFFYPSSKYRCKDCIIAYNKNRLKDPVKKAAYLAYQKAYRAEGTPGHAERQRRQAEAQRIVLEAKNRPCADCGKTFHPACMEFDHRDPTVKYRDVSYIASAGTFRSQVLEKEISKCDVVCACCHRLRSVKRGVYPRWYPG